MLALLSPSKTLDFDAPALDVPTTKPVLLSEGAQLAEILKQKSAGDIKKLMAVSDKLAELNYKRFQEFNPKFTEKNAKAAISVFKGDVYDGMAAEDFSKKELEFAQSHIRILSGLYGVLRPLDLMQAYRLEMGTKLSNSRGKDLYAFWGERVTQEINKSLENQKDKSIINLASQEYFKAVQPKQLSGELLTIHFKEEKGGQLKVVAFFAKRARGMMARFITKESVQHTEKLKEFKEGGYAYNAAASDEKNWVFSRNKA
jgi:hypothetical protein